MTRVQQIRKRRKILYGILFSSVIALIQALSILLMMSIYLYFFPFNHPNIGMGLSLYFYLYYAFPISVIIGNIIVMFAEKRAYIFLYFLLAFATLIYYWMGEVPFRPFKIGFLIFISVAVYSLGVLVTSRVRDWIS